MIPIELSLKNFMSYGAEPVVVPFEGLDVVCLSGDNGNGKSAILDAITWALWGKTRASAVKAVGEDDLIRIGADDCEVRFDFELNEQFYRAVRKRRRGKAVEWSLAQQDAGGQWAGIGGGSREIGTQLKSLLSMDYDTFLNSAYLQQGHADEFTRQTPDKRKGILSEILGLHRYERLEAMAKERAAERKAQADELHNEISFLDTQAGRLDDYRAGLESARFDLEQIAGKVDSKRESVAGLRDRVSQLDALDARVQDARQTHKALLLDIAQREKERCHLADRLEKLTQTLQQKTAILADYQSLRAARARREELQPQIEEFNAVSKDITLLTGVIDLEKRTLEVQIAGLDKDLAQIVQRKQRRQKLEVEIVELERGLTRESDVLAHSQAAQTRLQAAQEAFAALKARNEQVKQEVSDLAEVLALLARPHAVCPVCENDLSGNRHATVLVRQQAKQQGFLDEQAELKREAGRLKQTQTAAQEEAVAAEAEKTALLRQRDRRDQAVRQRDELDTDGTDSAPTEKQSQMLRKQLEAGEYAVAKRVKRDQLQKRLEVLGLIRAEYETVEQALRTLDNATKRYEQLQNAEANWQQEIEARERLEAEIGERQARAQKEKEKLDALATQLGGYEAAKEQAVIAEHELRQLENEQTRLRILEADNAKSIQAAETAAQLRKDKQTQLKTIEEERKLYNGLTQAFGKKGVQTLIIENALPELQEEANDLLGRLTDNAMHVSFRTVREGRSTKTEVETLDITITDDIGDRPYELFSGGEAFRINFAIRIALSRLLSRRAGAKLQTLILDEGFGTQDGKGREKLIEAIQTIKEDFAKIIVITHVDELKDAFQQRIEVTKDALGSHVHVV